jgi:hypothetical protein
MDLDFALVSCPETCGLCGLEQCTAGYRLARTEDKWECVDEDECELGTDNCGDGATCYNTDGTFSCECEAGFEVVEQDGVQVCQAVAAPVNQPVPAVDKPYGVPVADMPAVEDPAGEAMDDSYLFALEPEAPSSKPYALGMDTNVIPDDNIVATSSIPGHEANMARPYKLSGWSPEVNDMNPCITIDHGSVVELHGFGSQGSESAACWAAAYTVETGQVEADLTYLPDIGATNADGSHPPREFVGNGDGTTWKRHCIHRYYGQPAMARYVRICPVKNSNGNQVPSTDGCVAMRIETYGKRPYNDTLLYAALDGDVWTKQRMGCTCYFDHSSTMCACCHTGACQCDSASPHQCVQCGYGSKCGTPELVSPVRVDGWTMSKSGCACKDDPTAAADCACCDEDRHAVQCSAPYSNQCVQPGQEALQCGSKEDVFGPYVCQPKTCPP